MHAGDIMLITSGSGFVHAEEDCVEIERDRSPHNHVLRIRFDLGVAPMSVRTKGMLPPPFPQFVPSEYIPEVCAWAL